MDYLTHIKPRAKEELESLSKPDQCLVHRYLYYVNGTPILTDRDYDMLERDALEELDDLYVDGDDTALSHQLYKPGSDRSDSYEASTINLAAKLYIN